MVIKTAFSSCTFIFYEKNQDLIYEVKLIRRCKRNIRLTISYLNKF